MFFDDFPKISPCFPLEIPHFSYCQAKEDEIRDWLGPAGDIKGLRLNRDKAVPKGGNIIRKPWEKPYKTKKPMGKAMGRKGKAAT
jgi:hypothetical protein